LQSEFNCLAMSFLIVLGAFLGTILVLMIGYLLMFAIGYYVGVNRKYKPSDNGVDIYISTNGMHTDFIVPTQNKLFDWTSILDSRDYNRSLADFSFLGIGWGDYGFYLELEAWNKLTPKLAAKAMLLPNTPTLMHVTGYDHLPTEKLKVRKIALSKKQYLHLCSFIYNDFDISEDQQVQLLPGVGYGENDNFYKAHGSYHALHTCNYWVNKGLKKIGVRTALWSPLDKGIFYQLDKVKMPALSASV